MLLKNKTAVITGCSRGIGFSILETFSKNGANILACIREYNEDFKNKVDQISKNYGNALFLIHFFLH